MKKERTFLSGAFFFSYDNKISRIKSGFFKVKKENEKMPDRSRAIHVDIKLEKN